MQEIAGHTIIVLTLLTVFWGVERYANFLWGPDPKVFWGLLDIRYMVDTADAVVLACFFVSGAWHALKAYMGWNDHGNA